LFVTIEQLQRELSVAVREIVEARLVGIDKTLEMLSDSSAQFRANLEKYVDQAVHNLQAFIEARLIAMDKTTDMRITRNDVVAASLSNEIQRLADLVRRNEDLVDTRFSGLTDRFIDRDAVLATFQAQKEAVAAQNTASTTAVAKAEAATIKQIDGIFALMASNTKAVDEKIAGLSSRLDRGDGSGRQSMRQEDVTLNQANTRAIVQANLIAIVALVATILVGIYASSSVHQAAGVAPLPSISAAPQTK